MNDYLKADRSLCAGCIAPSGMSSPGFDPYTRRTERNIILATGFFAREEPTSLKDPEGRPYSCTSVDDQNLLNPNAKID